MDIKGLCKVVTIDEIREQNYSLNAGRYVGVNENDEEDFNFAERLEELKEEIELLNKESRELEDFISENLEALIGGYQ
jgi:type I restriction enzyme M protein